MESKKLVWGDEILDFGSEMSGLGCVTLDLGLGRPDLGAER